jgi:hypothetical protein
MSHVDLTDDQLAEYQLKWVYDFGWPALCYADRYPMTGALFDDLEDMFDQDVSKDDILLWLHEITAMLDEEEEEQRQWRRRHPVRHAVGRLGCTCTCGPAGRGRAACNDQPRQHHRTRLWPRAPEVAPEAEEASSRAHRSGWRCVLALRPRHPARDEVGPRTRRQ